VDVNVMNSTLRAFLSSSSLALLSCVSSPICEERKVSLLLRFDLPSHSFSSLLFSHFRLIVFLSPTVLYGRV